MKTPLIVRDIITQLEGFDPNAPLRIETCVRGRGCWSTDIIDIEERRPPASPGSPVLFIGVTADQWESRLEEVREKLERMESFRKKRKIVSPMLKSFKLNYQRFSTQIMQVHLRQNFHLL